MVCVNFWHFDLWMLVGHFASLTFWYLNASLTFWYLNPFLLPSSFLLLLSVWPPSRLSFEPGRHHGRWRRDVLCCYLGGTPWTSLLCFFSSPTQGDGLVHRPTPLLPMLIWCAMWMWCILGMIKYGFWHNSLYNSFSRCWCLWGDLPVFSLCVSRCSCWALIGVVRCTCVSFSSLSHIWCCLPAMLLSCLTIGRSKQRFVI